MSMAVKRAKGYGGNQGDPGLFGDIWSGIKSVGRVAGGIASFTGIPGVSQIGGLASRLLSKRHSTPGASTLNLPIYAPTTIPTTFGSGGVGPGSPGRGAPAPTWGRGININPPFGGPPGMGITPIQAPATQLPATVPSATMGGYHVNKTGYWVKVRDQMGNWGGQWQRIEAGTKWVKNRRRNPLNPRAASRAISRITSAKKATAMLGRVSIRKKC